MERKPNMSPLKHKALAARGAFDRQQKPAAKPEAPAPAAPAAPTEPAK